MSIFKNIKGFFGQTIHYKDGQYVGESWDGLFKGSKTHYDANGQKIGYSDKGLFNQDVHHNAYGGRIGESWTDPFGTTRHYSDDEGRIGTSYDGLTAKTTIIDELHSEGLFSSKSVSDIEDYENSSDNFFDDPW